MVEELAKQLGMPNSASIVFTDLEGAYADFDPVFSKLPSIHKTNTTEIKAYSDKEWELI